MAYRGADPTDVMGRRIGAYFIDVLLMWAVLAAVLIPYFTSSAEKVPSGTFECTEDDDTGSGQLRYRSDGSVYYETFDQTSRTNGADFTFCFDNGDDIYFIPEDKEANFAFTSLLFIAAVYVGNLVILQGAAGGSVGKLALGLRVVKPSGEKAGVGRSLGRTLLLPIDAACCAIVGLLTAFNSQGHRRVGDMVANTLVISRADQDALILARSGQALPDRKTMAAQQWSAEHPVPPPTEGSWDPLGGVHIPSDPSATYGPPSTPPASPPPGEGPTWDPARNAYIQYDRTTGAWMQFDDASKQWKPIDS